MINKIFITLKSIRINDKQFIWLTLIAICFIYNYNHIIFERPVGIHQYRNCVSASFSKEMYYGSGFWKPELENFAAQSNKSRVMQLEFPLLYYLVSLLYKIFGYHEFLHRLTNITIGLIGLVALFKTAMLFLRDRLYAWFIPISLFTSLVFIFYVSNFIPDPTALSFALVGLYFMSRHVFRKNYAHFVLAMLFFGIAGLLKAQALMLFFSFGLLLFLESVFKVRFTSNGEKIFEKPLKYYAGFILVFAAFLSYYLFITQYSKSIAGSTSVRLNHGIWSLSPDEIKSIWELFVERLKAGYFHNIVFICLTGLLLVHNLVFIKKYNRILNIITLATFFQGIILFNLAFFYSIGRCDYYQINNLVYIPLQFLGFFVYLKNNHIQLFTSKYLKIAVVAIALFLIYQGSLGIKERYNDWFFRYSKATYGDLEHITPYLRNLGIEREDRVYYTPDNSINISLYLMDQLGHTDYGTGGASVPRKIENLKRKGLKYFMLGNEALLDKDGLEEYLKEYELIGKYGKVLIYKIQ